MPIISNLDIEVSGLLKNEKPSNYPWKCPNSQQTLCAL